MPCVHLRAVETAIAAAGIAQISRGKAWSVPKGEWVYVDCVIDIAAVRRRFALPGCVEHHTHRGT